MSLSESDKPKYIKSEPQLPGWTVSSIPQRKRLKSRGIVPSKDAKKHLVPRKNKGKVQHTKVQPYDNGHLSPWQMEMSLAINDGCNVVVDAVTSTGKTWAANLITAHEILSRDEATAIIISPNSEVMRSTIQDIGANHVKNYQYGGRCTMSTITRNFRTYDLGKYGPPGQLMIISVENVVDFFTDQCNEKFIEKTRIIVFDEVHMNSVTEAMWWSQYIPHHAQLVLLSATLGNPQDVKEIVATMQDHSVNRPACTRIISCNVRPIPLQLVLFKGCDQPHGFIDKALSGAKRLSCAINKFDPTTRDIKTLDRDIVIPESREEQFLLGSRIIGEKLDLVREKNQAAMKDIVTEPNSENIYRLLSYLFNNKMQPVMVFNATTEQTKFMVEQLVGYINRSENEDHEYREASRVFASYEKSRSRNRDDDGTSRANGKKQAKDLNDWQKPLTDEHMPGGINMQEILHTMNKWHMPCDFDKDDMRLEAWIQDALDKGIGVYVSTMAVHARHKIYDAMSDGKIKVLFSDSSISVGINLPIRTVVLCGNIPHHLYKQAGGRAGRRGMDDRGYIVHMMPVDLISKYLDTETPEVRLKMPKTMSYADLIRLQVPANLNTCDAPEASTPASDISNYSQTILSNYMQTLTSDQLRTCNHQIALIHDECWHYHRLTNFIKTLPYNSSILLVKLMTTGMISRMEIKEFINLMALLFLRKEMSNESDPDNYYIPQFERIPELDELLKRYIGHYDLDIDISKPIHKYFSKFCLEGIHYLEYMSEIDELGEWLYIFKSGIVKCAPESKSGIMGLRELVIKADDHYLAARTRKKTAL